jgi:serine/threonine protein kinase
MEVITVRLNEGVADVIALKMPRYLTVLSDHTKLWPGHLIREGRRLVEAVEFIHARNIVHMDIKESNIFLKFEERKTVLLLGDFGSSKFSSEPITSTNLDFYSKTGLRNKPAIFQYDWYMLLITLLRQTLDDKTTWMAMFCGTDEKFSNDLICRYLGAIEHVQLKELLCEVKDRAFTTLKEINEIGGDY